MFRSRIFWASGVALALALTFGVGSASADTSILTEPNSQLTALGFTGPFGTVTINLTDATHANISFTSNTVTGQPAAGDTTIFLFGDTNAVALNVNASNFLVSNLTGSNSGVGFSGPQLSIDPGPGTTVDGFGNFNLRINEFDGYTWALDTVSFTLQNTSSTWGSAADVLVDNGSGWDAAAHIYPAAVQSDGFAHASIDTFNSQTGFAAEAPGTIPTPSVPEPSTMVIAGLGALGFVGYGLRRRLKK